MHDKLYKLGYVITKGNNVYDAGEIHPDTHGNPGWVDEYTMLKHVTKTWLQKGHYYVGVIIESKDIPTAEELYEEAKKARNQIIADIGFESEGEITREMANALDVLVTNRKSKL